MYNGCITDTGQPRDSHLLHTLLIPCLLRINNSFAYGDILSCGDEAACLNIGHRRDQAGNVRVTEQWKVVQTTIWACDCGNACFVPCQPMLLEPLHQGLSSLICVTRGHLLRSIARGAAIRVLLQKCSHRTSALPDGQMSSRIPCSR